MLKKTMLSIAITMSILGSSLSFAGNETQIAPEKREKVMQHKTVIESPDKQHRVEQTISINKDNTNMKSYDVSLTNITFRLNDKVDNIFNQFPQINDELLKTNDISKTFQGYGKIVKMDNQVQTVLAGNSASFINTKSIEYVNEVTNGEQSRAFIDIKNSQNFFINNLRDDKKLTVFLTINGAQLDSMSKIAVGSGSQESYIETPSISSYAINQAVVVKPGEYKLINMGSDSLTEPNPLFENSGQKLYKAVILKVSEQGS